MAEELARALGGDDADASAEAEGDAVTDGDAPADADEDAEAGAEVVRAEADAEGAAPASPSPLQAGSVPRQRAAAAASSRGRELVMSAIFAGGGRHAVAARRPSPARSCCDAATMPSVRLAARRSGPARSRTGPVDEATPVEVLRAAGRATATGCGGVVVVVVLLWLLEGAPGPVVDVLRAALLAWGLGLGGELVVEPVRVTVVPLGLLALLALPWVREARRLARGRGAGGAAGCICAWALLHAVAAGSATALAGGPVLHGAPLRTAVGAAAVTGLAAGAGWWHGAGASSRRRRRTGGVTAVVRAGAAACLVLLLGGALLAAAAVAAAAGRVLATWDVLGGGAGPLVAQAAYAPDAVLWATAFLLGPGVDVGGGATVSALHAGAPSVLPLPLAAALPEPGQVTGLALLALGVPVLAGAAASTSLLRTLPAAAPRALLVAAVGAAAVAGVPVAVLAALASGTAGPPGSGALGPAPVPVAVACLLQVTVWTAAALGAARVVRDPGPGRPTPRGRRPAADGTAAPRPTARTRTPGPR